MNKKTKDMSFGEYFLKKGQLELHKEKIKKEQSKEKFWKKFWKLLRNTIPYATRQ